MTQPTSSGTLRLVAGTAKGVMNGLSWLQTSESDAIARDVLGALTNPGALRLPTSHLLPQLERLIAAAPVGPNDAESAGAAQAQNTEIM